MNFERTYEPPPPRRRGRLLARWARYTLGVMITIPVLYYGIHLYFGAMPVVIRWIDTHEFYVHFVK